MISKLELLQGVAVNSSLRLGKLNDGEVESKVGLL
jgi:hypothetical protein